MSYPNAGSAHNIVGQRQNGSAVMQTRVSDHHEAIMAAAYRFENDYRYWSQDLAFTSPTINWTVGDFVAVTIPMGERDRLEIISTFAQLLMSDYRSDILAHPVAQDRDTVRLMLRIQSAINAPFINGLPAPSEQFHYPQNPSQVVLNPHEMILRPVLDALVLIDHDFAGSIAAEMWEYFSLKQNRHNKKFIDLETYFDYRMEDFGMNMWSTIIRFALRVPARLHKDIEDSLGPLKREAFRIVVMIDDIFGHNLELKITTNNPVNTLTVMQKLLPGLSLPDLKMRLLQDITTAQRVFKDNKTKWITDHRREEDLDAKHGHKYLQGLYDFVAGYHAWAETCSRYNET